MLTLPLTLLTFGFFLLVMNGILFAIAGVLVPGVTVDSFGSAFAAGIIVSIVSWTANRLLSMDGHPHGAIFVQRYEVRHDRDETIDLHHDRTGKWE